MLTFIPKGNVKMEQTPDRLWFTVTSAIPGHFHKESAVCRHYLEAESVYRLPLRIEMTVSLDAPVFHVMFGSGRITFVATWNINRRIEDIVEPHYRPVFYADHFPLNTPIKISVIYNLKSMQILINGEERYYSTKEKYMKSVRFNELNTAGLPLRLSACKRTEVTICQLEVTENETDFEITNRDSTPEPIRGNIDLPKNEKPTFDVVIAGLPDDIRAKIVETDDFLRTYKPVKFRRIMEKNGNKITYLASAAGVSYMIMPSGDVMRHSFGSYLQWNEKDNLGKRDAAPLEIALNQLAEDDPDFVARILSYKNDCTGCRPKCVCRVDYKVQGKIYSACHGKIDFKMAISEFDDVMRIIRAIGIV